MKKITEKQISTIISQIQDRKDILEDLMNTFENQHPELIELVEMVDDGQLHPNEVALFRHVLIIAWYITSQVKGHDQKVSTDFIDILLDHNADILEKLYRDPDQVDDLVALLSTFNGQKPLIELLLSMMYQAEEPTLQIRTDAFFVLLLPLKTAIDAMLLDEEKWMKKLRRNYSEKDHEESVRIIEDMFKKFKKSPHFSNLRENEKEHALSIITVLADLMYSYHTRMPEEWTSRHVLDCCMELIPGEDDDDPAFGMAIVPVLVSFFKFTGENPFIPRSLEIVDFLLEFEKDITGSAATLPETGTQKVARNDPCPCGSGKKYKKCCGR